jgi:DNA gyrase/topoisomerase IV subunit A
MTGGAKLANSLLQELILFSRADLERSIPSMVDGLKPGQRKILFCCLKRNIRKDVKARLHSPSDLNDPCITSL